MSLLAHKKKALNSKKIRLQKLIEDAHVRAKELQNKLIKQGLQTRSGKNNNNSGQRKKRLVRSFLLSFVGYALLLSKCQCVEPIVSVSTPEPILPANVVTKTRKKSKQISLSLVPRGNFEVEATKPLAWLQELQTQVGARSQKLNRCFKEGTEPKTVKWSFTIAVRDGLISDQEFEPILDTAGFEEEIVQCFKKVLESPPYRLSVPQNEIESNAKDLGRQKLSLILEF